VTTDPTIALIPARSQRQAMDWSLVLVSQDIETAIEYSEDMSCWGLTVAAQDFERAVGAIRQYREENRGWPWQREVILPDFVFDAVSVVWALLVTVFFWLSVADARWQTAGLMDNAAVRHGEWWRLFTAILLHNDLAHLATNLVFGLVLLGLAMGRFGTGVGLLAAYLAGAGGNLATWLVYPASHKGLGASGMIMGALGLLAAQTFTTWPTTRRAAKPILIGLLGGVMLFALLGLSPGTDVIAHAGGFVWGIVAGFSLAWFPGLGRNGRANLLAGAAFAAFVVLSWWRALR